MNNNIKSITDIESQIDKIHEKLEDIDVDNFANNLFGSENEYTFKGIIGGIKALLIDISALTKKPDKFIRYSSYNERMSIKSHLENINHYLNNINPSYLVAETEALKPIIRQFNIRFTKDRYEQFTIHLENITRQEIEFQEFLKKIRTADDSSKTLISKLENNDTFFQKEEEKIKSKLDTLIEFEEKLKDKLEEVNESIDELTEKLDNIEEKKKSADDAENEIKANQKLVDSFVNRINIKEKLLDEIGNKTDAYNKSLLDYKTEQDKILSESKSLIESAKQALNYKTAEGISASFQTQYEEEKMSNPLWWIGGAGLCLIIALCIGVWILLDKNATMITIVARVTMIPIPLIAAFFCTKMYTNRINIIQDYAYKMVLSKAIVGFSEQFKHKREDSNEEYNIYVKQVLEQIHQDPMRRISNKGKDEKKNDTSSSLSKDKLDEVISAAEKIMKLVK